VAGCSKRRVQNRGAVKRPHTKKKDTKRDVKKAMQKRGGAIKLLP
jgi:hypothetical protein